MGTVTTGKLVFFLSIETVGRVEKLTLCEKEKLETDGNNLIFNWSNLGST